MITKFYAGPQISTLADQRQVAVIVSTEDPDREGEIIVQSGIDCSKYMSTGAGPILWNHDPGAVIAKCVQVGVENGKLKAIAQFPPAGEDPEADRIYGKVKFGSVSSVSIGFNPTKAEPLDAGNPKRGPQKYLACELMEFSFTPVPANPAAVVVGKAAGKSAERDANRERLERLHQVEVLKMAHTLEIDMPTIAAGDLAARMAEVERLRLK